MSKLSVERVIAITHWNESVFSFWTTRQNSLRFRPGEFVMLGLMVEGKPLLRAYSMVSANYEEHLEFLSIKVSDGPLTSRLQHIKLGDGILIGTRTVGTLTIDDVNSGERLFLLASGTGIAPFMSIIKDPDTYERFNEVVLVHSVRRVSDLAYREFFSVGVRAHLLLSSVADRLKYIPTVTRESFKSTKHVTTMIEDNDFKISARFDRAMICGNQSFLNDVSEKIAGAGLIISPAAGMLGDFVIERAFVE